MNDLHLRGMLVWQSVKCLRDIFKNLLCYETVRRLYVCRHTPRQLGFSSGENALVGSSTAAVFLRKTPRRRRRASIHSACYSWKRNHVESEQSTRHS